MNNNPNGNTKPPFWSAKQNLISSSEKIEDKNWAMKINIFLILAKFMRVILVKKLYKLFVLKFNNFMNL